MGFFSSSKSKAEELALESKAEDIILTTMDLKRDYEILDIIWSEEVHMDLNIDYTAQKNDLKKKAAAMISPRSSRQTKYIKFSLDASCQGCVHFY